MHRIRLRKPWIRRLGDSNTAPVKVDVPDSDADSLAVGQPQTGQLQSGQTLIYQRSFNLPTGLEPDDRVRLEIDGFVGHSASILINDQDVHRSENGVSMRVDVTDRLERSNRLEIRLSPDPAGRARLSGAVSLMIFANQA